VVEKERQAREPVFDVEVTLDANGRLIRAEVEDPIFMLPLIKLLISWNPT